jgi:hypothetical protein
MRLSTETASRGSSRVDIDLPREVPSSPTLDMSFRIEAQPLSGE